MRQSMYQGKLVRLRKLNSDDASIILPHWKVYELDRYLPTPLPTSNEDMVRYIENVNDAFANNSMLTFGIETLKGNQLIGIISLVGTSWINRFGEVGHFAIFDLEYRGKGYGADALRVLLNTAFSASATEIPCFFAYSCGIFSFHKTLSKADSSVNVSSRSKDTYLIMVERKHLTFL